MPYRWSLPLVLVPACFAPHDPIIATGDGSTESGDESGDTSTGATATTLGESESSAATTTTAPDTSTSEADTTAGDAPPELSSFSVNGSEMPSEILEADMVEIQVAVDDDVGVALVEFFDGDTLIASFTEPPYHTQYLVTSADNGGHSFTAVAHDTAEQTAEAGPIPLSISIDGGAVLAEQDQLFRARTGLGIGAPAIVESADDIIICGASRYEGSGFTTSRVTMGEYSSGLSQLALSSYPASQMAASPAWSTLGAPVASTDGSTAFVVSFTSGSLQTHLHALDLVAETWSQPKTYDAPGGAPFAALGRDVDGALFMARSEIDLVKLSATGQSTTWDIDAAMGLGNSPGISGIVSDASGNALVDIYHSSGSQSLRKISADGDILWTRDQPGLGAMNSAAGPEDRIASVVSLGADAGLSIVVRDATGATLSSTEVFDGRDFAFISGVRYDVTGRVVAVGIEDVSMTDTPYYEGWAGRFDEDGSVIWDVNLDLGSGDDRATGLATTSDGRVYVAGMANPSTPDLFVLEGDVWLAELAL